MSCLPPDDPPASYDKTQYLNDPASIPPLSPAFPRDTWPERAVFGVPPYQSGEYAYEACWAAREASKCWARVLARENGDMVFTHVHDQGDLVDATCFKLAVLDKALEVNAFVGSHRGNAVWPPRLTNNVWKADTDKMVKKVYLLACQELPHNASAPPYEVIRPFLQNALGLWCQQAVLVTDVPHGNGAPFAIEDLGRFSAKYYGHQHLVVREDLTDASKFSTTVVHFPAQPYTPAHNSP